jgi:ElaB/YqjD/DUF883 family membrane-anchored ribosome-binding protein
MVLTPKGSSNGDANSDLAAIINDIASLKNDIASLAASLKNNAVNATSEATSKVVDQIGDQASRVYNNLSVQSQKSAKALTQQLEEQPIVTLLIAFALGFFGSRLFSNNSR